MKQRVAVGGDNKAKGGWWNRGAGAVCRGGGGARDLESEGGHQGAVLGQCLPDNRVIPIRQLGVRVQEQDLGQTHTPAPRLPFKGG